MDTNWYIYGTYMDNMDTKWDIIILKVRINEKGNAV